MDLGYLPSWTSDDYRQKRAGLMEVKRFEAMAANSKNLVIYDRSRFKRNTGLGA